MILFIKAIPFAFINALKRNTESSPGIYSGNEILFDFIKSRLNILLESPKFPKTENLSSIESI